MKRNAFSKTCRAQGLTVIEVLIVVGIIAVLMTLIVPISGTLTQRAKATQCMGNLRNLWRVWNVYMMDHRQKLYTGSSHWIFPLHSSGALTSPNETTCPATKPGQSRVGSITGIVDWIGKPIGYSINYYTFYLTEYSDTHQFSRRGETPLFMDGWVYAITPAAWRDENIWSDRIAFRHGDHACIIFLDGHLESVSKMQARSINPVPGNHH